MATPSLQDIPIVNDPNEFEVGKYAPIGSNILRFPKPLFPNFTKMEDRLFTFKYWPLTIPVSPFDLAEAGFFYENSFDRVFCFQCNGSLCAWKAGDEPMREHARFFPNCPYILIVKGKIDHWQN